MTLVAHSIGVQNALQAAEELAGMGVECEVVNLRSIRPLDMNTVMQSVMKTNNLVTVEYGWPTGGVGSEVIAGVIEGKRGNLILYIIILRETSQYCLEFALTFDFRVSTYLIP